MFSSGTNGVCDMIRTRPSFHSLSFWYLPPPAHIKLNIWGMLSRPFTENVEKTLAFPSKWRIIDNRNNPVISKENLSTILYVTQQRQVEDLTQHRPVEDPAAFALGVWTNIFIHVNLKERCGYHDWSWLRFQSSLHADSLGGWKYDFFFVIYIIFWVIRMKFDFSCQLHLHKDSR